MKIRRLIIALACVSGLSGACAAGGPSEPTCATVADHVMGLSAAEHEEQGRPPLTQEVAARRRQRLIERCEADRVSPDTLACLLTAENRSDVQTCQSRSTAQADVR